MDFERLLREGTENYDYDKSHYSLLPGMVCELLDWMIHNDDLYVDFKLSWDRYASHVRASNMDNMLMPHSFFNKKEKETL